MSASIADPVSRLVNRERLFVGLRFVALALLALILTYDPGPARVPGSLLWAAVAAGAFLNTCAWFLLRFPRAAGWLALLSAVGDVLVLLFFLLLTGGSQSPLWSFVFLLIAATALRYGMIGGLVTAALFAAVHVTYGALSIGIAPDLFFRSAVGAVAFVAMALMVGLVIRYEHTQSLREREQAQQALQRSQFDVQAFAQLSGSMSSNTNYQVTLRQMLELSIRGLHTRGQTEPMSGMILLFKQGKVETLYIAASHNLEPEDQERTLTPIKGAIKTALDAVELQLPRDVRRDALLGQFDAAERYAAAAVLPLRAGLTLYGVVVFLGTDNLPEVFSQRMDLMEAYATQAAIAVQNAQLYAQLRQERDRFVDSEEKTRHELARDLHDGPVNQVASLTMGIDFARRLLDREPARARDELEGLYRLAAKTARDMRMTMYRLRPLALEQAGLSAALEQYLQRLQSEREQPRLQFSAQGAATFEPRLSTNAAMMVFDIMTEAVSNALKHARAQNVRVNLQAAGDWLIASASDDGKGFDVAAVKAGYAERGSLGLLNIQERAELAHGEATIESTPGKGATVTVRVPLGKTP